MPPIPSPHHAPPTPLRPAPARQPAPVPHGARTPVRVLLDGIFTEKTGGPRVEQATIRAWIEDNELERVLETMKGDYPDASILLGNLREVERESRNQKIGFEEYARKKAGLRDAALKMLG